MKSEFRDLRLKQLAATLDKFPAAKQTARPVRGWLRAVREALGVSQQEVAIAAKVQSLARARNDFRSSSLSVSTAHFVHSRANCRYSRAVSMAVSLR